MLKVRVGITAEDALSYESEKIYVITMDSEVDAIKSKINIVDSISKFRPHLCHEKTQEVINMRLQFPGATNAELARRLSISREWVRQVLNRANLPTRAQSEYCELACDGCGLSFSKKKELVERLRAKGQAKFYHNKICYVKNRLHPLGNEPSRKWDYEAIYKLRREKNWGSIRIGRELGISTTTVVYILKKGNLTRQRQKRDYEAVYKLRREKGWGCVKIGKELGIPKGVVTYILKKGNLSHQPQKWEAVRQAEKRE